MSWSQHLNPTPWSDTDDVRRIAVRREPPSGVSAALRATFPVPPLSPEIQGLLDKLR